MSLTAANADRHALYEIAVQQPIIMIDFIEQVCPRMPMTLREDFCGTAYLSSMWVRSDADRRAVGVDLDRHVVSYAQRHSRKPLGEAARRLKLVRGDVLRCRASADVIVSLNFSHCVYKTRAGLLRYFRHVRRCLKPAGRFICDIYGGPGAAAPGTDKRRFGDFDYLWEQESFDPLTHEVVNHIHFRFRDGSMLNRAYTYRWRLWSAVELQELLYEAGLRNVSVCFESEEGFIGDYDVSDADAWVAYLVAGR